MYPPQITMRFFIPILLQVSLAWSALILAVLVIQMNLPGEITKIQILFFAQDSLPGQRGSPIPLHPYLLGLH